MKRSGLRPVAVLMLMAVGPPLGYAGDSPDVKEQDDLNRVWAEWLGGHLPTTTTVEVSRLATHPNCKIEISAIAVADVTPARARGKLPRPRSPRKSRSSHRTR